jgi:broad specificity phosphatase PhoE
MELLFIRHCQTTLNALGIHQDETSSLSFEGFAQAKILANYFSDSSRRPELIISSPRKRALQTAQIISKQLTIPVIESDLISNIRRPSEIINKKFDDESVIAIFKSIEQNFGDKQWKYSDEESFKEILERLEAFRQFIGSFEQKRILIVSHGSIINSLTLYLSRNGKELKAKELLQEFKQNEILSCSITKLKLDNGIFKCLAYNEMKYLSKYANQLITSSLPSKPQGVW